MYNPYMRLLHTCVADDPFAPARVTSTQPSAATLAVGFGTARPDETA